MTDRVHLHEDDCPLTIALLQAIVRNGNTVPSGWVQTDHGFYVEWDELLDSYLSTTEKAAVHIARGCAIAERHGGGFPARLRGPIEAAVACG